MKKIVFGLLLTCGLFAESIGVKELNYNIGASTAYGDYPRDDLSYKNYAIFSSVNIPIYKYLGSSIYAGTGHSKVDYEYFNDSSTDNYYYGGANIFLRDSEIGKIGIFFEYAKDFVKFDSFKYNSSSNTTAFYADYYFDDFTVWQTIYRYEYQNEKQDGIPYALGVSWYIQDNARIGFSYYHNDNNYDENSYRFSFAYQPSFFSDSVELIAAHETSKENKIYQLSINYHFSTEVSLKSRDREYR